MSSDKPLKMAVCAKCGTRFFVPDPTPGPYFGEMRILETAPPAGNDHQVLPVKCPACQQQHFAEFRHAF